MHISSLPGPFGTGVIGQEAIDFAKQLALQGMKYWQVLPFSYPGMGKLAVDAITTLDYNLVQGFVLWVAIIYMVINLLVDLSYNYIDPRMRLKR